MSYSLFLSSREAFQRVRWGEGTHVGNEPPEAGRAVVLGDCPARSVVVHQWPGWQHSEPDERLGPTAAEALRC